MQNYSNYRKYMNIDMVDFSGKFHFNEQLKQEGTDIKIDNKSTQLINNEDKIIRAIVRNTGIENKEDDEERSIMIGKEYEYQCGNYVEYLDDIYLTTVSVDKDNPFFNTAKMKRCNYILKWMDNGQLYETPAIVINSTKYTQGTKTEASGITEQSAMFNVQIPNIEKTKNIKLDKRFIINGMAWKVTLPDRTSNGLLFLTLGKSSINSEVDNLELEVADYYTVKHNYNTTCDNSISITKGNIYNLVYSFTDNNQPIDDNLITIENTSNLISVTKSTDGKITIIGIDVGNGNFKVKLNLTDEVREFIVNFDIVANIIPDKIDYNITTSNGYIYRPHEGSTLTAYKYINGTLDNTLNIEYQLDSVGQNLLSKGNITIIKKSNNSIQIRNTNVNILTTFTLSMTDKDTGKTILDNNIITLKSA